MPTTESAIELIAAERKRQVEVEGFDSEHDDEERRGKLAIAGALYALPTSMREWRPLVTRGSSLREMLWPWEPSSWKPTPDDRIRELVKAGALIVAEIERLQRSEANHEV